MRSAWVTTSWDDGHPLDFKLAELLRQYRLPATFYVPLASSEHRVMGKRDIAELSQGVEIGGHTLNHVVLNQIPAPQARQEIRGCKEALEDITGKKVTMFCYPRGKFNPRVISLVKDAGFIGARTAIRYFVTIPQDIFRLHTTSIVGGFSRFATLRHLLYRLNPAGFSLYLKKGMPQDWVAVAQLFFDYVLKHGGLWHLWGHSWEIEARGQWRELERLLQWVSHRPGVRYLANGELVQALQVEVF